jgi:hypothetical protein
VEVYFNRRHEVVQGIHCFDNMNELDPYLQQITLPRFIS